MTGDMIKVDPASTGYAGFSRQLGKADFSPPSGYAGRNDDRGLERQLNASLLCLCDGLFQQP